MTELNVQLVQHVDLFKGQLLLLCKFSFNIPEGEREKDRDRANTANVILNCIMATQ